MLEAFVLQSAYIESLLKLFVDIKLSLAIRDIDSSVMKSIKKRVEQYSLYELTRFVFDNNWLPKENKDLFKDYRIKRNKVLHDLLRQIATKKFDVEIGEVYRKGREISTLTEFSITDRFYSVIEKQAQGEEESTPMRYLKDTPITSRENEILRSRLEGNTLAELGDKYGVTRERIRQILKKAILKINGTLPSYARKTALPIEDYKDIAEVAEIISRVSKAYNVSEDDLLGSRRLAHLVFPRHLAIYFLRENLKLSFPQIAKLMRKKDHTTIMHAYRKVQQLLLKERLKLR